jgi:hypothetical protein
MTLPHETEVVADDGSRDQALDRFESRVVDQRNGENARLAGLCGQI